MAVQRLPLPTGSYSLPEPRASVRRLVNCFSESAPTASSVDPKDIDPPIILRRAAGVDQYLQLLNGTIPVGPVRGFAMMGGILYTVVGGTLYSITASLATVPITPIPAVLGSGIAGTGRVFITGNGFCLVVIIPGTTIGYTWTASTGLQTINSPTFLQFGALKVGFIDSYIVFLQSNGRGFYNDDGQITSGTGPITFNNFGQFPREYGTDPFVGMEILDRVIWCFGQLTTEAYIDVGNTAGSPFASAPNNFIEIGCINGQTVVKQNQSLFWIANDLTVRRLDGVTPTRISNHAIEDILSAAAAQNGLTDAYGLVYTINGHVMVVFTLPTAARTLVYDCTTKEWHEMSSYGVGYWRPFCQINAFGLQLVGDSQPTGLIGALDSLNYAEYNQPMIATWIHQPVYSLHQRLRHRRLEVVLGTGQAPLTGQGSNPVLTLQISDDGGHTWRTMPGRNLGMEGEHLTRAVWWNLGMARERVYQFNLSDPVELWAPDATLEMFKAIN